MFCKHCGSKIDDDVAFCPACGKPQGAAAEETGAAPAVPAAQGGGESYFDGGVFQWLGWKILGWLVTGFTFGICYPFAVNWMYSWEARHTVIDGRRLKFTGSAGGLFGTWILCLLLTFVTFGIYCFWVPLRIHRWKVKHTHLLADDTSAEEQESKGLTPAEERKSRELTPEERQKEKLFARLSAVGPVLTVAGIVMQTLYFILYIDRYYRRHFFEFIAPQCLLLLCTVGLLVLSRVKIENRSVVQLILITAALLFASLVANVVDVVVVGPVDIVGIVGTLLSLAGVAVSFVVWFKERKAAAEAAGDAAGE